MNFRTKQITRRRLREFLIIAILILFLIQGLFFFQFWSQDKEVRSTKNLSAFAEKIYRKCQTESYRPACYDREIPNLLGVLPVKDVFTVTNIIQTKDSSYAYCHVLGHKIAAIEVISHPQDWKKILQSCPVGTCANGCTHGVLQQHFRAETLNAQQIHAAEKELIGICESIGKNQTVFEISNCYHGLGHMTLFMTKGDLAKSIPICEQLSQRGSKDDFSTLCYDGMFMQFFQPQEPEDITLVRGKTPKTETLLSFCQSFPENAQPSCWMQGWTLYKNEIVTPSGFTKFCGLGQSIVSKDRCFEGVFHTVAQIDAFDQNKMSEFCNGFDEGIQGSCYGSMISAMFNAESSLVTKATGLCSSIRSSSVSDECYRGIIRYAPINFPKESSTFRQICNTIPEKWKKECLQQT